MSDPVVENLNRIRAQVEARTAGFEARLQTPPVTDVVTGTLRGGTQGLTNTLTTDAGRQAASLVGVQEGEAPEFRVRLAPLNPTDVYGPTGILQILKQTNGLVFPYTPSVSFSQAVNYTDLSLVHTNGDIQAYQRTPSVSIQIQGKFSVQNAREAEYSLAALHFLRTVSKSYFGVGNSEAERRLAGTPPPMLVLSGYGTYMFNKLKCVLENHSWTFDEQQDLIPFRLPDGGTARLPPLFSISLTVKVQNTPSEMRREFSLNEFRTGALMRKGGWI